MRTDIAKLSDKALVNAVHRSCSEARATLAHLLVLLIEVEERSLHLKEAYPSMFAYCRGELRMSEGEASRRINAARLVHRFPKLLSRIECGDIHLSALYQLRDYFNDGNLDHLVDAAKGKNKFEIAEIIARLAPRAGGRASVRKLPHHDKRPDVTPARKPSLEPLAEALYRLQVFGDRVFRDKLFRARDMLMHSNPTGDLSVVIARALDELLNALEKRRYGKPLKKTPDASLEPVNGVDATAVSIDGATTPAARKPNAPNGPSLARTDGNRTERSNSRHRAKEGNAAAAISPRNHFRQRGTAALAVARKRAVKLDA